MVIDEKNVRAFLLKKIRSKSNFNAEKFPEINDDFSFITSGLFDSMDFLNLMTDTESEFNITIDFSDAEPEEFTTLKGFIKYCLKDSQEIINT